MQARRPLRVFIASLALCMVWACGPILSSSEITSASDALERAASVDAVDYATYEFVSAEAYLGKAREEWGYSDFQVAVDYARRARDFAIQAYERAVRDPARGAPVLHDVLIDEP